MRCPNCTTALCGECGTELRLGVQVPEVLVCEDHRDLCSECASDLWCKDCHDIRKGIAS